ncbi:MAG: hypothetical protein WCI72_03550 [archaeon]
MNKNAFILFALGFFLVNFASATQNFTENSLEVSVDILATQDWAEIELNTTSIDFGTVNMTTGSVVDKRKNMYYEIRNKGNVNITVTPSLADGADPIFDNLKFSKSVSDSLSSWKSMGDYSINMTATDSVNLWSTWQKYAIRLDLSNYLGAGEQIPFKIVNYKKTVVFEITAA